MKSASVPINVLIVTADPDALSLLRGQLVDSGDARFDVITASGLAEADEALRNRTFDLLLVDLSLPESRGLDALKRIRGRANHAAVLALTESNDDALAAEAIRDGAQDCLIKGQLTARGVARAMRHALERHSLERGVQNARADLERQVAERTAELVQLNRELRAEMAEREKIDVELRTALAEVNLIFDNAVVGIAYVRERRIGRVNPRFCEMFGYPPAAVLGRSTEMFYPSRDEFESLGGAAYPVLARDVPYRAEVRFRRSDGSIFWAQLHGRTVMSGAAEGASIWVFEDIDERKRAEEERRRRLARIETQVQAVGAISMSDALLAGDVDRLAREVTEAAARATGVERANVWLFNEDESELRCIDLYEATTARHSAGARLRQAQFENEFAALKSARYVNADDPLTDPRTAGYVEAYLKPLRISSMLDATVQFSDRHLGLLCLEHVDRKHHWEEDEITFACQLADKIALAITSRQRLEAQRHLTRINRTLSVLSSCNMALVHASDEPGLLHEICKLLADEGGYPLAWVGFSDGAAAAPPRIVAVAGPAAPYVEALEESLRSAAYAGTAINQAILSGRHVAMNFHSGAGLAAWRGRAERFGLSSVIALPLVHAGKTLGVLAIYSRESDPFDADECKLLDELANDLAYGLSTLSTRAERDASVERARRALEAAIAAIGTTLEMRDPYTSGHQCRVADLAVAIAREMGLDSERIHGLRLAATVHDIGKISVPAEILSKPSRLTPVEFELIKTHPQSGFDILKHIEFPWPVAEIVHQHHEKLDGSGYPQGLKDGAILPEARVLAVADVVEAMASHRPYRPGLGVEAALEEVSKRRGTLFDAAAVDACLRLFREKRYHLSE